MTKPNLVFIIVLEAEEYHRDHFVLYYDYFKNAMTYLIHLFFASYKTFNI